MASLISKSAAFFGLLSLSIATPPLLVRNFAPQDIITRDVVIIGGGATGTYAAVRLREDFNKTVVVIERTGRLGGHTETYFDPVTGFPVDYGVQAWIDGPIIRAFTGRFNIPLVAAVQPPFATEYIDFKTGKPVVPPFTQADVTTALTTYFGIVSQWPFLVGG
jgi:phytoene dehydrogenase-like protein